MRPTISTVCHTFRPSVFRFIDLDISDVVHTVAAGDGWVLVIGHPENASYEWVYLPGDHAPDNPRHSDCGYGGAAACLRDGLIDVEGLPEHVLTASPPPA